MNYEGTQSSITSRKPDSALGLEKKAGFGLSANKHKRKDCKLKALQRRRTLQDMQIESAFKEIPENENVVFNGLKKPQVRPISGDIRDFFSATFNEAHTRLEPNKK